MHRVGGRVWKIGACIVFDGFCCRNHLDSQQKTSFATYVVIASFHSTSNCKRVFSWPSLRCRTLGIAGQTYLTKNPKARFQDDLLERPCRCREECYATYRLSSNRGYAPMTKGFWKTTILPRSPVHSAIVEKTVPSLQPEGLEDFVCKQNKHEAAMEDRELSRKSFHTFLSASWIGLRGHAACVAFATKAESSWEGRRTFGGQIWAREDVRLADCLGLVFLKPGNTNKAGEHEFS